MLCRHRAVWALSAALFLATSVARAVDYDEGVSGDITGDRLNPLSMTLSLGSNLLTATSVSGDREYVHYELPSGYQLSAIVLQDYASDDGLAFIGVQAGTTFTESHMGTNPANILGYTLFGTGTSGGTGVGDDLLDDMGASDSGGAQGFVPPLTGPDYTFWIQQTGVTTTYTLDFQVVPEPGSVCLLAIGALLLVPRIRRGR